MKHKKQMPRKMDAPIYGYWNALYMAFYSRRLYVDVGTRWRGIGFFYVWLMVAVTSIPLSVRVMIEFNQFINDNIVSPLKTIPPLELQQGEFSFNKPMPYFVKSKTGAVVAMIDTRTNGQGMKNTYPELMLLVTKDKVYFRPPTVHLFANAYDKLDEHDPIVKMPDKHTSEILVLSDWLDSSGLLNLKWIATAMIYPFIVSFFFGLFFTFFLLLAMLAQVFSWLILKCNMTFTESFRLLVVASTVQLAVLFGFMSMHLLFPELGLICVALCVLYFSVGVLSVKRERLHLVRT